MHLSMKRLEFRCQEKDLGLRREHLIVAIQIAQGSVAGHIDSATNVRESNQEQLSRNEISAKRGRCGCCQTLSVAMITVRNYDRHLEC